MRPLKHMANELARSVPSPSTDKQATAEAERQALQKRIVERLTLGCRTGSPVDLTKWFHDPAGRPKRSPIKQRRKKKAKKKKWGARGAYLVGAYSRQSTRQK